MQTYVKSCLVFQMDKTERKKVVELLQPLPILEKTLGKNFHGFHHRISKGS